MNEDPHTADDLARRRAERRKRLLRRRRIRAAIALLGTAGAVALLESGSSPDLNSGELNREPATVYKAPLSPRASLSAEVKATDSNRSIDKVRAYTPYVAVGSRRKRQIALTFDDGPGPLTPRVARLLKRAHVPATFFVVGQQFADFRDGVPLEKRLGFTIGNHTENHRPLRGRPAVEQRQQIRDSAAKMHAAGVPYVRLFRPPGRSFDANTFKVLNQMGLLMVLWTVDSRDYRRPGAGAIVSNVLSGARPGAIVLMHDSGGDRSQTLAALPTIISRLRRRGYKFVTVPALLAGDPPPRKQRIPATGAK